MRRPQDVERAESSAPRFFLYTPVRTKDVSGYLIIFAIISPIYQKVRNDKPLFIWQAEVLDGIQLGLVMEACRDLNRGKSDDEEKYFRGITVRDENTKLKHSHAQGEQVGYVVTTRTLPLEEYLRIVRRLLEDNQSRVPMIVYLPFRYQPVDLPGEQYVCNPDFELWAKDWADSIIPDFIRGDGDQSGITYRWYNRYNDPDRGGCHSPAAWLAVGSFLNGSVKLTRNYRKNYGISDLGENLIRSDFQATISASKSCISNDVIDDFIKYLKNNG